jgi:CRP-like cAMP-binding protein
MAAERRKQVSRRRHILRGWRRSCKEGSNDPMTTPPPSSADRRTALAAQIKRVPLFGEVTDPLLLDMLVDSSRVRRVPAGTTLFLEGDDADQLYVVLTGAVNIQKRAEEDELEGRVIHIARRGPGEHFGELALIDDETRMADAVTAEQTDLLIIRRDAFRRCVRERPELAFSVMKALARRQRESGERLAFQRENDVLRRVAALILAAVDALGATAGPPSSTLKVQIDLKRTHKQIGDEIGATRESVSRALATLERNGIVVAVGRGGRFTVTDVRKLRALCDR